MVAYSLCLHSALWQKDPANESLPGVRRDGRYSSTATNRPFGGQGQVLLDPDHGVLRRDGRELPVFKRRLQSPACAPSGADLHRLTDANPPSTAERGFQQRIPPTSNLGQPGGDKEIKRQSTKRRHSPVRR